MSDVQVWQVHIDGAARGNPGPAAFAYVIARAGTPDIEEMGCLGSTTNNQAEYTALVRALQKASELGARRLHIHSDSELLVKQMNGEYRVKNEGLRELYKQAKELSERLQQVTFEHVPRERNRRADELCNQALDGAKGRSAETTAHRPGDKSSRRAKAPQGRLDSVRDDALHCLRSACDAWARHDPHPPRAEDVWDHLCSLLEEHGIVSGASAP